MYMYKLQGHLEAVFYIVVYLLKGKWSKIVPTNVLEPNGLCVEFKLLVDTDHA